MAMIKKKRRSAGMKELRGDRYIQELITKYTVLFGLYLLLFLSVFLTWIGLSFENLSVFWMIVPLFICSYRWPQTMSAFIVFLIGVLTDIVFSIPLGLTALCLLVVVLFVRMQERFLNSQHFMAVWLDFVIISFLFTFCFHGLSAVALREFDIFWDGLLGMFVSWAILVGTFPPIFYVINSMISTLQNQNRGL